MTTLHLRNSISRSPLGRGLFFIPLALCCFALSPAPNAFGVRPAPDGGYPGANTAEGTNALFTLTTGTDNTAVGFKALYNNTTGGSNTANGDQALFSNTTGGQNTANGDGALFNNTTGIQNTANGANALQSNTTGNSNTAAGFQALFSNTTGIYNTANGLDALQSNTTGSQNTATGLVALNANTTGSFNTANGVAALSFNTTGGTSTANGVNALHNNTTGSNNTADGSNALQNNTTGSSNITLGYLAGSNLTTGDHNIDIANNGVAAETKTIRIGDSKQTATFIAGIAGATVTGSAVYIDTTSGQLGLLSSSKRFKDGIEPMGNASEALLSLRPVTFRYKKNIDPKGAPQFGLVAEEVEKVNPDLVVRDAEGKVFTVRYEAVNAMLLNEFLKEHRKVEELERTVVQTRRNFQATAAHQQEQIEALTAGLQRVSAQVVMSRPAPQMVLNNQ
jgi:trimeric autotransporter adhesin